jgi:flagellar biosynthetic protein FliR
MFITLPVLSVRVLTAKVKVLSSLLITLVIVPVIPDTSHIVIFSYQGFMVAVQQIAIGVSTGFILQMVFSVMLVGGQSIAYSMGLGFASMVDPATGIQVPVIAQVFVISGSLIFLSINGHLLVIEMLVESFRTLPVGIVGLSKNDLWHVISWSSRIFSIGLVLALPIMATLLFVNFSFGVAARAAPQLQIFGVGFPITIMLGMVLVWISLDNVLTVFTNALTEGYTVISNLLRL